MISKIAVEAVFARSLKLKSGESCLIVADTIKEPLGKAFYEYASKITKRAELVVIQPTAEHATEPPAEVAKKMLEYDVQILVTDKSLTHTAARRKATEKGARIATMPGINEDIANRCLDIDYDSLRTESRRLYALLKSCSKVVVTTALGTNMEFTVGSSDFFGKNGGSYDYPGSYGNLPEGEVSFSPENSSGVFVVDASFPGLGLLKSPVTFKVRNNVVYEISGENSNRVKERLDRVGPKAYLVAELGIGLNEKAKIIGYVLEDEKVLGSVHIALGNNCSYGRDNDVPLHLDGVITAPDLYLDEMKLIEKGRFIR